MSEKELGTLRFGRFICIGIGFFGCLICILSILLPDSLRHFFLNSAYLSDYEQYKILFRMTNISFVIFQILSVGLVAFFYMLVRPKNYAKVFFTSLLGAYGSFLGALYYLKLTINVDRLYWAVKNSDSHVASILLTLGLPNYEQLIFIIGLPAIWWIVVSFLSLDNSFIPKSLVIIGFLIGLNATIYLIMLYFQQMSIAKWLFLLNAVFITIWSVLEFKFINRAINSNRSN